MVVVVYRIGSLAKGRQTDERPAIVTASGVQPFAVSVVLACWHAASACWWTSHDCCCVVATKSMIVAAATIAAVVVVVEPCQLAA